MPTNIQTIIAENTATALSPFCTLNAALNAAGTRLGAVSSKNKQVAQGNPSTSDIVKSPKGNGVQGVGGAVTQCRLAVAIIDSITGAVTTGDNGVDFEMMPARKSHLPNQGQQVPGAGAGLETILKPNLTELKVPGARPIPQAMGIAGEYVEFVGCFIGFDEYVGEYSKDDGTWKPAWDNHSMPIPDKGLNAWEKSQRLVNLARSQQDVVLQLQWDGVKSHAINFSDDNGVPIAFVGQIKGLKRTYATPQRVYYWIQMAIFNRDDLQASPQAFNGSPVVLGSTSSPVTAASTAPTTNSTPAPKVTPAPGEAPTVSEQPAAPVKNGYIPYGGAAIPTGHTGIINAIGGMLNAPARLGQYIGSGISYMSANSAAIDARAAAANKQIADASKLKLAQVPPP